MFVRVHHAKEVKGGNKGTCFNLANYLTKEGDGRFFSHLQGEYLDALEVTKKIDANHSKLSSDDAQFFLLSINPSQQELSHLLGREVKDNKQLTENDRLLLSEKLELYTRVCLDEYAKSFARDGIESGGDLLYFAKIETERRYKFTDHEVLMGRAKVSSEKEGLNWHVHIIVSRKSKSGTTKLSPNVTSGGNEWFNGEGRRMKRGFDHLVWKRNCGERFEELFKYRLSQTEKEAKRMSIKDNILLTLKNKDLKEILSDKIYPSVIRIDEEMEKRGWVVMNEEGKHVYSKEDQTFYITDYRLRKFVAPVKTEDLQSVAERFNPFEVLRDDKSECGDDLIIKEYTYKVKGEEKRYISVYDKKIGVEIPAGKVFRNSDFNRYLEKISNGDFRNSLLKSKNERELIFHMQEKGWNLKKEGRNTYHFSKKKIELEVRKDPINVYFSWGERIKTISKKADVNVIHNSIKNKDLIECIHTSRSLEEIQNTMGKRGYKMVQEGNRTCFEKKGEITILYTKDIKTLLQKDTHLYRKSDKDSTSSKVQNKHLLNVGNFTKDYTKRFMNKAVQGRNLDEIQNVKHLVSKTSSAMKLITNPKSALRNLILSKLKDILVVKEL